MGSSVNHRYVCVAVCCSVLQCVAVCCCVLQCVVVCCSVLQCVAVCCSRIALTTAAPYMWYVPHVLIYTCIGLFYMCIGLFYMRIGLFYMCKSCDLDSNCSDLHM